MQFFKNLSFRYKLLIPLGILTLLFVYVASSNVLAVRSLGNNTRLLANTYMVAIDVLLQADRDLYQSLVAERSMLFVERGTAEYETLIKEHAENMQQAEERVGKFAQAAEQAGVLDEGGLAEKLAAYNQARQQWETLSNEVVSLSETDRQSARALSFGQAAERFGEMRNYIDKISEVAIGLADRTAAASEAEVDSRMQQGLFELVVGLVIAAFIAITIPPMIIKPLKRLNRHLDDIAAGEGDLTVRLEENSKDELGQLSVAFNRFVHKIHNLVSQAVDATRQLSQSAEGLVSVAKESNDAVSQQLSEIDMVATAMNEMTSTVQEVAQNAGVAAQNAREADEEAGHGRQVVNQTVTTINDLASSVENASNVIHQLEKDSANISVVLDVIKGIAEQTNLLALNAAIEAARAGEQGRGFAVVADEVRVLAMRTQESTQEINNMIETLQQSAADAVKVMEEGRSRAEQSVEQAGVAGNSLSSITDAVSKISDMNAQIASAAEEQSAVSEEINRNTSSIQELAYTASQGSDKTTHSANEMADLAGVLHGHLSQFKV
ncbi:MAG: methyl-accepting chemotaxis protein [Pseudomonadota bacterium]|nr:methyl-accepting chemotaxis protein [Pseudomonadota bacterium]